MYKWLVYGNGGWLDVHTAAHSRAGGRVGRARPGTLSPASTCAWTADSKHLQADQAFFQKREFCFTMDGDIFVRYQSFKVGAASVRAQERMPRMLCTLSRKVGKRCRRTHACAIAYPLATHPLPSPSSLQNGSDLAEAIVRKCPSKIDIGPVYSCNPQERLKYAGALRRGLWNAACLLPAGLSVRRNGGCGFRLA